MSIFKSLVNKNLDKDLLCKEVLSVVIENENNYYFSSTTVNLIKKYSNKSLTLKLDDVKSLWKNILIDSISFLKVNDCREKLFNSAKEIISKSDGEKEFLREFSKVSKISSFGIDELDKYFNDFVDFEKVLYGAIDSYRDHVDHVIQVWAMGLALIDSLPEIEFNDKVCLKSEVFAFQFQNDENNLFVTKGEIRAIWSIIALCHDLGYPIEKASKINKNLRKIISHFGTLNINEFDYSFGNVNNFLIEKFLTIVSSKPIVRNKKDIEKYGLTAIQSKYRDKLSKSIEDYKHGSFSGLLIFKTLTFFLETDISYPDNDLLSFEDTRQFFIRREILRAICSHTCPKLYHLNLNTLPFILIFCDELHEFDRPRFEDMKISFSSDKDKAEVKIKSFKFSEIDGTLTGDIHSEVKYTIDEFKNIITELGEKSKYDTAIKNISNLKKYDILVKSKFKMFHHLLRSAKNDNTRAVKFKWDIYFNNHIQYTFYFDSNKSAFEPIETKVFIFREGAFQEWSNIEIYE